MADEIDYDAWDTGNEDEPLDPPNFISDYRKSNKTNVGGINIQCEQEIFEIESLLHQLKNEKP